MSSWLAACRPKTLTTSLVPIGVGAALSYAAYGALRWDLNILALLSSVMIQIGTNLINDAYDFKKGADTAERLGPQRLAMTEKVSANTILKAGIGCFIAAMLLAIPLVIAGGWPLILIGIASLIAGYAYTGGPYPLAYLGLGDLFVVIFFGWIAVSGVYYLNTGLWEIYPWIAGSHVGFLATVLIAINTVRDQNTDRKANKKTMAVRLGAAGARLEIALLAIIPFIIGFYWVSQGLKWAFLLPLVTLPMAVSLIRKVYRTEPGVVFNQYLAQGAALHLVFGILLTLGLVL